MGELFQRTSTALTPKPRRVAPPKISSRLGSDTLRSLTNMSESTATVTKSLRKTESKLFDDQHIEEIIAKAPAAAHAMLKVYSSTANTPRDSTSSNEFRVFSAARRATESWSSTTRAMSWRSTDSIWTSWLREGLPYSACLDIISAFSIRPTCDIVKPRRPKNEIRPPPKQAQTMKLARSDPKFAPMKLGSVLPSHHAVLQRPRYLSFSATRAID